MTKGVNKNIRDNICYIPALSLTEIKKLRPTTPHFEFTAVLRT